MSKKIKNDGDPIHLIPAGKTGVQLVVIDLPPQQELAFKTAEQLLRQLYWNKAHAATYVLN